MSDSTKQSSTRRSSTKERAGEITRRILNQRAALMPTVSYEDFIQARAAAAVAELDLQSLAPQFRTEEHRARIQEGHVQWLREQLAEYSVLGHHYAHLMENPATPDDLHNALLGELVDLADKAGLQITSPEVLRLLYPMLRFRAAEKGNY